MRSSLRLACAGASLLALAPALAAHAEQAAPSSAPAASSNEPAMLGEIVVTARRRAESLQEVPQVVNAVTSDTLQKLNITNFQDIQAVVPGVSLTTNNAGNSSNASMRGITYNVLSAEPSSVAFYLNDAPAQSQFLFQSMFDVGQIEVLKGPQGTSRGLSAPSGSITVTSHKPDLSDFGGYVSGLTTDLQSHNIQGALNVPLIKDVLAVRVAALYDENGGNFVRSIHSNTKPDSKTSAERITVSYEPSDKFNATVMYQHMDFHVRQFQQEVGPGPGPGPFLNNSTINPPLTGPDRAAVDDAPTDNKMHFQDVTAQIDSRIFGQHLSYVGSYFYFHYLNTEQQDNGNSLPGFAAPQYVLNTWKQTSQEIRLSSDPAPGRFFDYTVGAFYGWTQNATNFAVPALFGIGAFGPPGPLGILGPNPYNPTAFNGAYETFSSAPFHLFTQETSLFGTVTFHLDANTELTGGVRHIWSQAKDVFPLSVGAIRGVVLPSSFVGGGANCPALSGAFHLPITQSLYPGFCDFLLPASNLGTQVFSDHQSPNVYSVSLSHHFTRDLLAYANTGTSYLPGYPTLGLQGGIALDPRTSAFVNHPPETSRAYEVGVKSTWFDGRARLNVALFRQRFHNFGFTIPSIQYFNTTTGRAATANDLSIAVDALVQGFDIDGALQITPEWNISLQGSYADSQIQGSPVLCNTFDAAGNPTFNYAGYVSLCNTGGSASHEPLWNSTLQSEYNHPVTDRADGFLRGVWSYYPENKRREEGLTVPAYSLVNLYAGMRSHDGAWEVSLFARNVFNNRTLLDKYSIQEAAFGSIAPVFSYPTNPNTGYFRSQFTPPREVGVSVRYAWGSR